MGIKLKLRIRKNTAHDNLCHMWIIGQEGSVEFGVMHGTVNEEIAELLASAAGLPVDREEQNMFVCDGAVESSEKRTHEQRELF